MGGGGGGGGGGVVGFHRCRKETANVLHRKREKCSLKYLALNVRDLCLSCHLGEKEKV